MSDPFFITLPYEEFSSLIDAARAVPGLIEQNKSLQAQLTALRGQLLECFEKIGYLDRLIQD